jgi:phosphate transport system permease protein
LSRSRSDTRLAIALAAIAILSTVILALIVLFLLREAAPVLQRVGLMRFFTDASWNPVERLYGIAPMLVGTLAASTGAVLLAAPLGIGSALFCRYYAPAGIARIQRALVSLLAGIPSVVYGFWGLVVLVPAIAALKPPGASLPTVALTTDSALAAVPVGYSQGAALLGLSREAAILHVLLPAARAGIGAGVLLATARALGETLAVIMVSGNVVQLPASLFDPIRTLTANIALEMAYATGDHRAALFVSGLALTAIVTVVVITAWRLAEGRVAGSTGHG